MDAQSCSVRSVLFTHAPRGDDGDRASRDNAYADRVICRQACNRASRTSLYPLLRSPALGADARPFSMTGRTGPLDSVRAGLPSLPMADGTGDGTLAFALGTNLRCGIL